MLFDGSFGLASWDGTTATFSATTSGGYTGVGSFINFDVTLRPAPVPEPMTLALFGAALAGLMTARRRA